MTLIKFDHEFGNYDQDLSIALQIRYIMQLYQIHHMQILKASMKVPLVCQK